MSILNQYSEAMMANDLDILIRIEKDNDVFGYPPEIVSIGLAAIDKGECHYEAIDNYLEGK